MFGIEGLNTVTFVIISLSGVFIIAIGVWFLWHRGAYKRALNQLDKRPTDELVIHAVIRTGRDYYFDQHMYAQLPPNSRLHKMSQLARMRQGSPYHFDVHIRNEMVKRTKHNYDSRFPHLTPDESHNNLPQV
ncbi:MAG: hypothetical protein ACO3F2_13510 [Roseiflexaceae bacterium]|jgi:hypothetical protein